MQITEDQRRRAIVALQRRQQGAIVQQQETLYPVPVQKEAPQVQVVRQVVVQEVSDPYKPVNNPWPAVFVGGMCFLVAIGMVGGIFFWGIRGIIYESRRTPDTTNCLMFCQ